MRFQSSFHSVPLRPTVSILSFLSILVCAFWASPASADGYPCYACSLSCEEQVSQFACNDDCDMEALYCVGEDQWDYCDGGATGEWDTVIQCGDEPQ